jgi:hypothetical protein
MKTVKPIYQAERYKRRGEINGNYGPGYIGFSYRDNNVISEGIAYFTEEEAKDIKVSHSFYVVDQETIIEAEFTGVIMSDPKKYFDNPHAIVFFKKPIHLFNSYITVMSEYALSLVGKPYDYGLFINFLYQWFVTKILRREIPKKDPPLLDNPNGFMCSEVSASTLNRIPEYSNLFPLSEWHPARISPMLLFGAKIFEEWKFD